MPLINYPKRLSGWEENIHRWAMLKAEYGASGLEEKLSEIETALQTMLNELAALPEDEAVTQSEPNDLAAIQALRPAGERRYWSALPADYIERVEGAFIGRAAGCTLGSIVEGWTPDRMERWAEYLGDEYPLVDYWSQAERPHEHKYETSLRSHFTQSEMDGIPTDDDIIYTQLGLIILEEYGLDFSIEDVGAAWVKYLPFAFTAEGIALNNLRAGVPPRQAADVDNPCEQFIGADIRCDPWGYAAPGYPEKAAEFAYRDAYVTHRRNGIYGSMYFAAAIAAAFALGDVRQALEAGLQEIPADCLLAREIRWALDAGDIKDYRDGYAAVSERHAGMHKVHAVNNACLTVFGLLIGGDDFSKVIGHTVAMGYDNDCTAATAGSIFGAAYGKAAIPKHWWKNFNNKVHTYLYGKQIFAIDDLMERFAAQAGQVLGQ